jgi:hypothetical protein
MRITSLALSITLLTTASAFAQEAGEVKLDAPKAKAIAVTEAPHKPGAMAESAARVFVYLDAGKTTRTTAAGKAETFEFKAGDVRWVPAGNYKDEIVSDQPVRIVKVEPRRKPPYSQGSTKLDAPITDPAHYKTLFDNEQVRALRITFPPHSKGEMHEHLLDRAVVDLTRKNGVIVMPPAVRISGYNIHIDSNETDEPAERIAIELK